MTNHRRFYRKFFRRFILSMVLPCLVLLCGCSRLNYDVVPDAAAQYHSLRIKVMIKNLESGEKDNLRILLKYNHTRDKMLFLSPMNQVYGLMTVKGEKALFINTRKKKFWKGRFHDLMDEMWGLDFAYREFKDLLVSGVIPDQKTTRQGIRVTINRTADSPDRPDRLTIRNQHLLLKIKISNRRTGKGRLSFNTRLKGMKRTDLRDLFI